MKLFKFQEKAFAVCSLLFVIAFLGAGFLPVSASVLEDAAQAQTQSVITDCPSYAEFVTELSAGRILSFHLSKNCTIPFDDEIAINSYVSIQNTSTYDLEFYGQGDVTVDHDDDDENDIGTRLFNVSSYGSLYLENVTLKNGKTTGKGGAILNDGGTLTLERVVLANNEATDRGGAIYNSGGTITINQSTFRNNQTTDGDDYDTGNGGAMYNINYSGTMTVRLTNSTFEGNHTGDGVLKGSGHGGAIYNFNVGGTMSLNVFNSTFANNRTGSSTFDNSGDGGAIYSIGYGSMALSVFNSTFSANQVGSSRDGDVGEGGALFLRDSSLSMAGTLLANSKIYQGSNMEDCAMVDSVINDGGYNGVERQGSCDFKAGTTQLSDPGLYSAAGNYGGETETIPLSSSSVAVNAIPVGATAFGVSLCGYDYASQDQRGEYRPGGALCDIGAYEIVDDAHPYVLPAAGFAPGVVTTVSEPLLEYAVLGKTDQQAGMVLEIPRLGVSGEVVGVPQNGLGWDVTWLGDAVGYLNGTTFPTWDGNSVLTGHSINQYGQPSVFNQLNTLAYGDKIMIRSWGQTYVYTVERVEVVYEGDTSVLADSDQNMLTLITCTGYDRKGNSYISRTVVQAFLSEVR